MVHRPMISIQCGTPLEKRVARAILRNRLPYGRKRGANERFSGFNQKNRAPNGRQIGLSVASLRCVIGLIVLCIFLTGVSCETSGMYYKKSQAWSLQNAKKKGSKAKAKTLKAGTITADKPGAALSIEKEISQILPLLFLERGYIFTNDSNADYIVDVCATEREYFVGWETKKSVTMEVLVWPNDHVNDEDEAVVETPLAAGRIIAQGSQGLSSSHNLNHILRRSVSKAVAQVKKIKVNVAPMPQMPAERGAEMTSKDIVKEAVEASTEAAPEIITELSYEK